MARIPSLLYGIALSAVLLLWAVPAAAQRTFVEALDTSSPEAVVAAFLETYPHGDYFTVHYLLSAGAKRGFRQIIATQFSLQPLFPGVEGMDLPGARLTDPDADDLRDEILQDPALYFDDLLFAADRAGVLPFRIGPGAEVVGIEVDGGRAVAEIATDAEPGHLSVRLIRLSSGEWRIESVAWAGSIPDARPWGVAP